MLSLVLALLSFFVLSIHTHLAFRTSKSLVSICSTKSVTKSCEAPNPEARSEYIPNLENELKKKFFIETHGCQMNLADSDVVRSVLLTAGYEPCDLLEDADLILTNTCAIRENAENKIWQRLKYFNSLRSKAGRAKTKPIGYPKVGVLGCMAERLKTKLLKVPN